MASSSSYDWNPPSTTMPGHSCDGVSARGVDCGFNASTFSTVTAVIWILTALPLLLWAAPCLRRQWSASRPARASLLLAALSAICCCADDLLKFQQAGYGNQTLWSVGSVFLVFGVCAFATAWCDVAAALSSQHVGEGGRAGRLIAHVRATYKWMALMHIPFAVLFSIHDYKFAKGPTADIIFQVWGAWLLFGTLIVLSGLAVIQLYIARKCLDSVPGTGSLRSTALINLVQQALFDLLICVWGILYASDNKTNSSIIAAYHSIGFVTFWGMHAQLVLFFAILRSTDPLYGQNEWLSLIEPQDGPRKSEDSTCDVEPAKVGSPSNKEDIPDMA